MDLIKSRESFNEIFFLVCYLIFPFLVACARVARPGARVQARPVSGDQWAGGLSGGAGATPVTSDWVDTGPGAAMGDSEQSPGADTLVSINIH